MNLNEIEGLFSTEDAQIKEQITRALLGTRRPGMKALLAEMERVGFYTAACSGGHHLSVEGGLAQHSWNVYEAAHKIGKALLGKDEYAALKNSITIATLLHDLGKAGDFGMALYIPNVLKNGKVSASKAFKQNKELPAVPHAIHSLTYVRKFINVTPDEEWAILCHDGLYDFMRTILSGKETALMLIVHDADMWSSHITEIGDDNETDE